MATSHSLALHARRAAVACAALFALSACRAPEHEPPGTPPEPQATGLRDAIQDPLDKGQAVEGVVREADQRRREQEDDAP